MELRTPGGAETVENALIAGNLTAIGLSGREVTGSDTGTAAASILADLARSYFERWNASDEELARLFKVVPVRPTVSACLVSSADRRHVRGRRSALPAHASTGRAS